jgi:hypothetical protein
VLPLHGSSSHPQLCFSANEPMTSWALLLLGDVLVGHSIGRTYCARDTLKKCFDSQRPEVLTRRGNLGSLKSTYTMPKRVVNPSRHSQLSM